MRFRDSGFDEITERIIGCAYRVSNGLGCGFLEKVYENALAHEIRKAGLSVKQQQSVHVHYDGVVVGEYVADLLVADRVLVELKVVGSLDEIHMAQCLNYLKGTGLKHVCSSTSASRKSKLDALSTNSNPRPSASIRGFLKKAALERR